MRVRMIRPGYWTDADLHTRLSADAREFYIGLWMESDDGGYVAWDVDRIGADLYPYKTLAWRRLHIARWLEALSVNGHVRLLECGKHVVIPNLTRYQHCPKPAFPHQTAHRACGSHGAPRGATGDPVVPAQEGKGIEGKGIEGKRGKNGDGKPSPDDRRLAELVAPEALAAIGKLPTAFHPVPKPGKREVRPHR